MNFIKQAIKSIGLWRLTVIIYDEAFYFLNQTRFLFALFYKTPLKGRVSFFFNSYSTGGAEKVQYQIVKSVADTHPTVFFVNYSRNGHYKKDLESCGQLFDIYYNVRRNDFFYKIILRIIANKINRIPDAVAFGGDNAFFLRLVPLLSDNVRIIDLFHSLVHEYEIGPETWSLPIINRISYRICISEKLRTDFINWYKKNNLPVKFNHNLRVIYNYTDLPNKVISKNQNKDLIVLFVCRKDNVKRISLAALIANRLAQKGFLFYFIGDDLIDEVPKNLRSAIQFTGGISDLATRDSFYEKAHILLMTSSREGIPMTIMEGMGFGLVPVSTNVGGISEMVTHGENGILLEMLTDENKQINSFCKALLSLQGDREKLEKLGSNARNTAYTKFSKEKFESSYRNLILG